MATSGGDARRSEDDPSNADNFLALFNDPRSLSNFTALQFAEVWKHYDHDGNGFIEGKELDDFLCEFVSSALMGENGTQAISPAALEVLKQDFMDAFDDNADDRIEIAELAQILPTEETFLLLFRRDNPLDSSVEFMKVWKQYDKDRSGYIEGDELMNFLKDLMIQFRPHQDSPTDDKLIEYTTTMLQLFDKNKDGKLQLSEMARLLPVKENYLCRPIFKNASRITRYDIDRVFNLYDRDSNGTIENEELKGFLKDLLELAQEDYDEEDMDFFKKVILDQWDIDKDGKINKEELKMLLMQQCRVATEEITKQHNSRSFFK